MRPSHGGLGKLVLADGGSVFKQPRNELYSLTQVIRIIVLFISIWLLATPKTPYINFLHRLGHLFVINRKERMWERMAEREKGPPSSPSPFWYYCALLLHCSSRLGKNICRSPSPPPPVAHQIQYRTECEPASLGGIGGVGVIRARNVLLPMGHKSSRAGHGKAALATKHGVLEEGLGWGGRSD